MVSLEDAGNCIIIFLYQNWCPHSIAFAPEYKEVAYTIKERKLNATFIAVDCDEASAERLCTGNLASHGDATPRGALGHVPSVVMLHSAAVWAPPDAADGGDGTSEGDVEGDGEEGDVASQPPMPPPRILSVVDISELHAAIPLTAWMQDEIHRVRAEVEDAAEGLDDGGGAIVEVPPVEAGTSGHSSDDGESAQPFDYETMPTETYIGGSVTSGPGSDEEGSWGEGTVPEDAVFASYDDDGPRFAAAREAAARESDDWEDEEYEVETDGETYAEDGGHEEDTAIEADYQSPEQPDYQRSDGSGHEAGEAEEPPPPETQEWETEL